ncbi:hypothetical protein [Pantoea sp. C2G6]|uniref:hypothetical protein n=1 Tax=Pantoea sp. C2G6 TaxID=3243084 RepID=UPI003ED8FAD5
MESQSAVLLRRLNHFCKKHPEGTPENGPQGLFLRTGISGGNNDLCNTVILMTSSLGRDLLRPLLNQRLVAAEADLHEWLRPILSALNQQQLSQMAAKQKPSSVRLTWEEGMVLTFGGQSEGVMQ